MWNWKRHELPLILGKDSEAKKDLKREKVSKVTWLLLPPHLVWGLGYAGLCSTHCGSSRPQAQPGVLTFPTLPYSCEVPCHGTEEPASKRQNPEVQKMTIRSWRIPLPSSCCETVLKCSGLHNSSRPQLAVVLHWHASLVMNHTTLTDSPPLPLLPFCLAPAPHPSMMLQQNVSFQALSSRESWLNILSHSSRRGTPQTETHMCAAFPEFTTKSIPWTKGYISIHCYTCNKIKIFNIALLIFVLL